MMRIKECKDNWNASSIIKRDNSHIKTDDMVFRAARKDTKRWCRGKKGTKHVYERFQNRHYKRLIYAMCVNCHRYSHSDRVTLDTKLILHIYVEDRGYRD